VIVFAALFFPTRLVGEANPDGALWVAVCGEVLGLLSRDLLLKGVCTCVFWFPLAFFLVRRAWLAPIEADRASMAGSARRSADGTRCLCNRHLRGRVETVAVVELTEACSEFGLSRCLKIPFSASFNCCDVSATVAMLTATPQRLR